MNKVYVLIDTEAGWDCIKGVFSLKADAVTTVVSFGVSQEDAENNECDQYYIHECIVK